MRLPLHGGIDVRTPEELRLALACRPTPEDVTVPLSGGRPMQPPTRATLFHLEVLVMPNGDIRCLGRPLGRIADFSSVLTPIPTIEDAKVAVEAQDASGD